MHMSIFVAHITISKSLFCYSYLTMKQLITLLTLLSFSTPALAGGDMMEYSMPSAYAPMQQTETLYISDNIWMINTNLPANHPCANQGGEWRGWCMQMGGMNIMPVSSPIDRAQTLRIPVEDCSDISDRSDRRACYRKRNLRYWGVR